MQAYDITYTYKGRTYNAVVDAKDAKSARNKIARTRHKLNAIEAKAVKLGRVRVIEYF